MKMYLVIVLWIATSCYVFSQTTPGPNPNPKICVCESENKFIVYEWKVGPGEGCLSGKAFDVIRKTYSAPGPGVRVLVSTEKMESNKVQEICAEKNADGRSKRRGKHSDRATLKPG